MHVTLNGKVIGKMRIMVIIYIVNLAHNNKCYRPMSSVCKYSLPSESTQASTLTKSATKEGILHLSTAVFPRITYSETTSASKYCVTTEIVTDKFLESIDEDGQGQGNGKGIVDAKVNFISGTIIFGIFYGKGTSRFVMPRDDVHKIRHKRRNGALDDSGISANYIFVVNF